MSDRRIRKIVILGGGTAGWMTAAALAKVNSAPQFQVTVVESDEIGIIGVGEATIPTIHWFNRLIGLDEAEFLRDGSGMFAEAYRILGIDITSMPRFAGGPIRFAQAAGLFTPAAA